MSGGSCDAAPEPLGSGAFAPAFDAANRGATFKTALEELLLALDDGDAERLMQTMREASGAWFVLLASSGGRALFVGNPLSGAVTPLAQAGFHVTCLDASAERARFAELRNAAHVPGRVDVVVAAPREKLPFADRAFDVVVAADGVPTAPSLSELRRVCARELVLVADNRLAYKRSSGRRHDFHVQRPLEFAKQALLPEHGERTLIGYRRSLARDGFERTRALSLYPHSRDFTHVVAIDDRRPALMIGPLERKNRWKLVGRAIGLFPVLTPSFAIVASRRDVPRERRIERMLAEIAERTGEPRPEIEQLVATRGNTAVVLTSVPDADPRDPRGRWTLHVPLGSQNLPQFELHFRTLGDVRRRFPNVPVPEPLFCGRCDGVWATCERRLPGWNAAQLGGDRVRFARTYRDAAAHFAELVVRPARPFDADDFEREVAARIRLVSAHAAVASTIASLERLVARTREMLVGRSFPLVLYHADLRGKHVQVDEHGGVIGYLDWGTTEPHGLPYFDLLHLVVHERKQERGGLPGAQWRALLAPDGLLEHERTPLESYRNALALPPEVARAIEELYPALVAAMAERNWDYSRPRWLHRQFGV